MMEHSLTIIVRIDSQDDIDNTTCAMLYYNLLPDADLQETDSECRSGADIEVHSAIASPLAEHAIGIIVQNWQEDGRPRITRDAFDTLARANVRMLSLGDCASWREIWTHTGSGLTMPDYDSLCALAW